MKKIMFASYKGGTGKTTTTYNVSTSLASLGNKVLVIDCDPQANLTKTILGEESGGCENLFSRDPNEEVVKSTILNTGFENLYIIPTDNGFDKVNKYLTVENIMAKENLLKRNIDKFDYIFSKFDYIFFDTNPSLNITNINCYVASDSIVLVGDRSEFSLDGIRFVTSSWNLSCEELGIKNNIKSILLNKDKKTALGKVMKEVVFEEFSNIILETTIPDMAVIEKATLKGDIIIENKAMIKKDNNPYVSLITELIEKEVL